jgi:hypothetical protein
MAGVLQYPVLNGQDPWAVGFFFDKLAKQIQGAFIVDESMYSQGVELVAYMDPHNVLPFGVTQWDALPVNRGPPSFDDPYATEIFNTYFWPMICHTNMRILVSSSEEAIMLSKARVMEDAISFNMMMAVVNGNSDGTGAHGPRATKGIGRTIKPWIDERWTKCRPQVALDVLTQKFGSHPACLIFCDPQGAQP